MFYSVQNILLNKVCL